MTDLLLEDLELWKLEERSITWLDCNQNVVQLVTEALNRPPPILRPDAVREQLKMNIGAVAMFGDPEDDPFLNGIFGSAADRDELLDRSDQVKIYDALLLVRQQIGRMALGSDGASSSSSARADRKARRSFVFDSSKNAVVLPETLHPLLMKISQNLVVESDYPFFKRLISVMHGLLHLVPPYNRQYRESWMHFFAGVPAKAYETRRGYEWVTDAQAMLLRFLNSSRKEEYCVAEFLVSLIEVDLAGEYIRASTKDKEWKAIKSHEPPGKKKKVESDQLTVHTNNSRPKRKEELDDTDTEDTDDLDFSDRIPSRFAIAHIILRPKPAVYNANRRENKFLDALCEGFFAPNSECVFRVHMLYARLLMACMDALAQYGVQKWSKVASKTVEPITSFDDIEKETQKLISVYIRIIAGYMKKQKNGHLIVTKHISLTWLQRCLLEPY